MLLVKIQIFIVYFSRWKDELYFNKGGQTVRKSPIMYMYSLAAVSLSLRHTHTLIHTQTKECLSGLDCWSWPTPPARKCEVVSSTDRNILTRPVCLRRSGSSSLAAQQYESTGEANLHTTLPNAGQQCHTHVQKKKEIIFISFPCILIR